MLNDCVDGFMMLCLADSSNEEEHVLDLLSSQTKDCKNGICCFFFISVTEYTIQLEVLAQGKKNLFSKELVQRVKKNNINN